MLIGTYHHLNNLLFCSNCIVNIYSVIYVFENIDLKRKVLKRKDFTLLNQTETQKNITNIVHIVLVQKFIA